MSLSTGRHHLHKRERIHQDHEPYPHPDSLKRTFDHLMYLVGMVVPLLTIPQAWKVWSEQSTAGLSLITWSTYVVSAALWLTYATLHKEKPLMLSYSLFFLVNTFIVIGIFIYR